ncbi:hypothetical protein ACFCV3_41820 [Kribbella sp. NPDC056345]|uniref:hypothetical protein n=1 Tax=Kribbella sp. NPDC056345 TaxID=3345789 RepID=UPI0035DC4288
MSTAQKLPQLEQLVDERYGQNHNETAVAERYTAGFGWGRPAAAKPVDQDTATAQRTELEHELTHFDHYRPQER